jgi:hypothetical protein
MNLVHCCCCAAALLSSAVCSLSNRSCCCCCCCLLLMLLCTTAHTAAQAHSAGISAAVNCNHTPSAIASAHCSRELESKAALQFSCSVATQRCLRVLLATTSTLVHVLPLKAAVSILQCCTSTSLAACAAAIQRCETSQYSLQVRTSLMPLLPPSASL